jgi:hypothetical protein
MRVVQGKVGQNSPVCGELVQSTSLKPLSYNQTTRYISQSNKLIAVQTQRAVVSYPLLQLLPELKENILAFL